MMSGNWHLCFFTAAGATAVGTTAANGRPKLEVFHSAARQILTFSVCFAAAFVPRPEALEAAARAYNARYVDGDSDSDDGGVGVPLAPMTAGRVGRVSNTAVIVGDAPLQVAEVKQPLSLAGVTASSMIFPVIQDGYVVIYIQHFAGGAERPRGTCPVCLERYDAAVRSLQQLPCGHAVCAPCTSFIGVPLKLCPMCHGA
jgi:hypothetical protein